MSIGAKIKNLRELRNYTQAYMADQLNMSVNGYSKIEREETDVSLSRLEQIAKVLETDLTSILNFDSKNVFNFSNNQTANGIVNNQNIHQNTSLNEIILLLKEENQLLRELLSKIR
jgi:transcriptional regulator with XRE-family HTH domain